jgi:hypothetical protein
MPQDVRADAFNRPAKLYKAAAPYNEMVAYVGVTPAIALGRRRIGVPFPYFRDAYIFTGNGDVHADIGRRCATMDNDGIYFTHGSPHNVFIQDGGQNGRDKGGDGQESGLELFQLSDTGKGGVDVFKVVLNFLGVLRTPLSEHSDKLNNFKGQFMDCLINFLIAHSSTLLSGKLKFGPAILENFLYRGKERQLFFIPLNLPHKNGAAGEGYKFSVGLVRNLIL